MTSSLSFFARNPRGFVTRTRAASNISLLLFFFQIVITLQLCAPLSPDVQCLVLCRLCTVRHERSRRLQNTRQMLDSEDH